MRNAPWLLATGAVLVAGPVVAQETTASAEIPVQGEAAPVLLGGERILAEIMGLEPAGEPVVSRDAARGRPVLTAPMRLREEGRLAAAIATDTYRMAAGAPVVHREFKPRAADQSEAIQAWCGPGEQRGMFGWAGGITVCMVHTADGKANLGSPQLAYGSWWMANNVGFASLETRTERVAVEPVQTPSEFNLVIDYDRLRTDGVGIRTSIEGPGMTAGGRPYRSNLHRRVLPVNEGVAALTYDGLRLTLTPQADGGAVAVASQRVAPPLDLDGLRARVEAASGSGPSEGTTEAAQDDALTPTPFVVGGVRLDMATMTAGVGLLSRGGVVLSGTGEYAVTARLTKPLNLRAALVNDTAPEGLVLHRLEFARTTPLGARTMTRIWCGPIGAPTVWSRNRVTMCLRRGAASELEAFWPSTGRSWLGTTAASGSVAALQARGFEIETSPVSLLEPLGVRVEVQRLTDTAATLRFIARKGNEDAVILSFTADFEDGTAAIPLWSYRLLLTRVQGGVTAQLTEDGDGESPTVEGYYP